MSTVENMLTHLSFFFSPCIPTLDFCKLFRFLPGKGELYAEFICRYRSCNVQAHLRIDFPSYGVTLTFKANTYIRTYNHITKRKKRINVAYYPFIQFDNHDKSSTSKVNCGLSEPKKGKEIKRPGEHYFKIIVEFIF